MTDSRRHARQNHLALAQQVINIALERAMKTDDHLPEKLFSEICGVSRTPMRSAFKLLEESSILYRRDEEGYFLALSGADELARATRELEGLEDSLANRILSDRAERRIDDVQSVSSLVRKYNASRNSVLFALKILSQDGIVTQLPGRSWAFQPMLDSTKALEESLAFRLILEPQAILAPGFALDGKKAAMIRGQMADLMNTKEGRITSGGFMRVDTEFHCLIAECSANRFARGTLLAHHKLRRATQKNASVPDFRLRQSLEEHLGILDSLEQNQFDIAADQMVLHLRRSRIRRPEAANRGIPPLIRRPRA